MKKAVFIALLALLVLACAKNRQINLNNIRIKNNPAETLQYIGQIGIDFDSALDSLRILKPHIGEEVSRVFLEVLFDDDDRLFYGIMYGDCGNYSDVLDTKGCYYNRTWYSKSNTIKNVCKQE